MDVFVKWWTLLLTVYYFPSIASLRVAVAQRVRASFHDAYTPVYTLTLSDAMSFMIAELIEQPVDRFGHYACHRVARRRKCRRSLWTYLLARRLAVVGHFFQIKDDGCCLLFFGMFYGSIKSSQATKLKRLAGAPAPPRKRTRYATAAHGSEGLFIVGGAIDLERMRIDFCPLIARH